MKVFAGILLFVLSSYAAWAESPQVLRYFQSDARYDYRIELLERVLHVTREEFGPAILQAVATTMSHGRGELSLENGRIDVAFLATNLAREQKFRAIKYPILQGILGYRILLVHKDRQADFAGIENLGQLTSDFIGGFGTHWGDTTILKDNYLKIITNPLYQNLFAMLDAKRFDYFPRGINEIWHESAESGQRYNNIVIEETLALYYPYPVYYFVAKDNRRLAKRIELGLRHTIEDGSLRALFLKYHSKDIKRSQLHKRKILMLENNQLPHGTANPDSQWWLQLTSNTEG
ncbi:transporter substrate-binding domain-containing protein [Thalassomonas actiniarum]|uniref:Transporter substrate-binding domain-containing protein n=1 Tax=Thalassomonas actiniarum TaxID=485447 RepID=A0AAE9YUM5_9GAMM|nr:transporter substrate-binding domain-containing protein [Thalassomonas actiniarum]WDE01541.1 transporter substrate-binding domain-containing protein [Thalassomonas actiniarum]